MRLIKRDVLPRVVLLAIFVPAIEPESSKMIVMTVPLCSRRSASSRSTGACALSGAKIEVRDETGAPVGQGILGDRPWPGTDALYWTEIVLAGPSQEGQQCWSVAFAATDLELPHLGSSAEFSFTAVKPPEHRVAVAVTESEAAAPVEASEIALGPYRAATDKAGVAHIEVPGGIYNLAVWKSGFEPASRTVQIAADVSVQLELIRRPKELTVWD